MLTTITLIIFAIRRYVRSLADRNDKANVVDGYDRY
jgi:hypothetical protein